MSGFSRAWAAKVLGHTWGKTEAAKPAKVFLALLTAVPTNSSTGSTITEATYTGYVRTELPAASISAAEEAAKSKIENSAELTFPACTGSTSTITAWALCDASSAGNVVMWGTATSTVISTTQTPPTIAAKKLIGELE